MDISKAGDGTITVDIEDVAKKSMIPSQITSSNMGSNYEILFTPPEVSTLFMKIFFNDVEIADSPKTIEVFNLSQIQASGSGLSLAQVDKVASFVVDLTKEGHEDNLLVDILGKWGMLITSN